MAVPRDGYPATGRIRLVDEHRLEVRGTTRHRLFDVRSNSPIPICPRIRQEHRACRKALWTADYPPEQPTRETWPRRWSAVWQSLDTGTMLLSEEQLPGLRANRW